VGARPPLPSLRLWHVSVSSYCIPKSCVEHWLETMGQPQGQPYAAHAALVGTIRRPTEGRRLAQSFAHTERDIKDMAIPDRDQAWIEARKRFNLSHTQIQMARELGMNPKKFGSLANHDQEPWKAPLAEFIEDLYQKTFRKARPDMVRSIEDIAKAAKAKKDEKKARKRARSAKAPGDE
jgi:hypothetical protein